MAYGSYKDLVKKTESEKCLRNKTFKIGIDPKYDRCQRGLALMVYKIYDKKSSANGIKSISNQQLEDKLHESIIKKV